MFSCRPSIIVLALLAVLNAAVDVYLARAMQRAALSRERPAESYTFIGDDYPERLPMPKARKAVQLAPEESVRFAFDKPESIDEWLWVLTDGDHNIHLGDNQRFFSISMTHQQHCLLGIAKGLRDEKPPTGAALGHITHCLNYIREATLCAADTTLEPPDILTRNFTSQRVGESRSCMDWPTFYHTLQEGWRDWVKIRPAKY